LWFFDSWKNFVRKFSFQVFEPKIKFSYFYEILFVIFLENSYWIFFWKNL
jgi:hypothetical protein